MNTIGKRIKHLRQQHYLTQRELAKKTGITRQSIIQFEADRGPIRSDSIIALSKFFHVSTDWLLLGDGEEYKGDCCNIDKEQLIQKACEMMKEMNDDSLQMIVEFVMFEFSNNISNQTH